MSSGRRYGGGEDVHQEGPVGGPGARGGVPVRDGQGPRHAQLSQRAALSAVASVEREPGSELGLGSIQRKEKNVYVGRFFGFGSEERWENVVELDRRDRLKRAGRRLDS